MILNQGPERSVKHQFGYSRSLRTSLKNAFLVVLGVPGNALCLDRLGPVYRSRASFKCKGG